MKGEPLPLSPLKVRYSCLLLLVRAAARERVPNVLSRCHTKRRTSVCGRARPSFGIKPTYKKKRKKNKPKTHRKQQQKKEEKRENKISNFNL